MNISPSQLETHGYYLYARFEFEELVDLISRELRRRTPHMILYWVVLVILALGALAASIVVAGERTWIPFAGTLVAIAGMIPVIPIHELLHALAFRLRGARRIRFGARFRYLMFYAIASDFIADYREMLFILYLPAAAVSAALLIGTLVLGGGMLSGASATIADIEALSGDATLVRLIGSALPWLALIHWSACAGDAALASYMWRHRNLDIVTGDEGEKLVTSFYVRTPVGTARRVLR
ncbi:MAG: DUF3267 domain-containing protein [Spirochaetales bacterium]